jgi:hypothetical protein
MDSREFFGRYARSPWGIATLFVSVLAGIVAGALGAGLPVSFLIGVAGAGATIALGFATGRGQRSAIAEADRDAASRAAARIRAASEARARLAALRLPAGEAAGARDLVVLEAGRLAETFARSGAYDPEAAQAVLDSLELADALMKERDQAATERRYNLPDAEPFPEAERRVAAALRDKAALIASRRASAAGEIPSADIMAIEEELK